MYSATNRLIFKLPFKPKPYFDLIFLITTSPSIHPNHHHPIITTTHTATTWRHSSTLAPNISPPSPTRFSFSISLDFAVSRRLRVSSAADTGREDNTKARCFGYRLRIMTGV
ncbi:hypothetical protein JTE90_001093 [Oedothorax gibbosus]|uniref:Uncharacterized protein n=1 Tax=Oedothorax gibbosus TaxID=931172 RepID=A0AAV6UM20_9ARAC|nr:hypothetical protein JTE90_001093 [Oedothorax gibbosus]